MKNKRSFTKYFLFNFIIVGVISGFVCVFMAFVGYVRSIEQQYFDIANQIADSVRCEILDRVSAETVKEWADAAADSDTSAQETIAASAEYREIEHELSLLREHLRLNDIYVITYSAEELRSYQKGQADWKPLIYLFDNYAKADDSFSLGERSSMNPKNKDLFAEVVETLRPQDKFIISNGEFGNNMSSLVPILTDDGKLAAVVGVEVPMIRVREATGRFILRTIVLGLLIITVIIWQFIRYLLKHVAEPVDKIAAEVCRFGSSNDRTEESIKALKSIQTGNEIQTLAEYIDKMEKDMIDYVENIRTITAEKERIGAELNVATQIQADMLPCIFPAFPDRKDFEIYASMTPAKEVGGDFYDFFLINDDHMAMVMADVSGKGVPAALFMVISKTLINDHTRNSESPAEILSKVNELLLENNAEGMFVTVWLGIMQISTGRIICCNAGHELPALRKPDGDFELIKDKHGMMVGVMPGIKFIEYEMQLEKGGTLFLYTDGVPEATNANNELFRTERMVEALNINPAGTPEEILTNVKSKVDEFVGEAPQFDDLTMLAITRK